MKVSAEDEAIASTLAARSPGESIPLLLDVARRWAAKKRSTAP